MNERQAALWDRYGVALLLATSKLTALEVVMHAARRSRAFAFALFTIGATLLAGSPAVGQLTASFDWGMAARYGLDLDRDGLIDEPTTPLEVSPPSGFRVSFDGCASSPPAAIHEYRWTLNGTPVFTSDDCRYLRHLMEGVYEVSLTVVDRRGLTDTVTERVVIQDFLILAVGDSFGSGEGNPVVPANLSNPLDPKPARWQSTKCHRSQISGQAQAALLIEDSDPRTSVTLVHLACAGAQIDTGLLGPYEGTEPTGIDEEPQIRRAVELAAGRDVDALVVSIGGNDLGFADIVQACMTGQDCHDDDRFVNRDVVAEAGLRVLCAVASIGGLISEIDFACNDFVDDIINPPRSGEDIYNTGIPVLQFRYDQLATEIRSRLPDMPVERVYVSQYPTMTQDEDGVLCHNDPPGFARIEVGWAHTTVLPGLNTVMLGKADRHGWTYVSGVESSFRLHGYCSSDSWVRKIQDSFVMQLNKGGSVHPNAAGQASYRDFIYDALRRDLYVGGDLNRPRDPLHAPVADAGGPYRMNEGENVRAQNGSFDPGGDPLEYTWRSLTALQVGFSNIHAAEPLIEGLEDSDGWIELEVSDGFLSDTDATRVVVDNVAPAVKLEPAPTKGEEGLLLYLSGSFDDPGEIDTHTGSITWGDGKVSIIPGLSSQSNSFWGFNGYADDGVFTAIVTIIDDDGGVGVAEHQIELKNASPTVSVDTAAPDREGSASSITVSFDDPGVADTHTAAVDWGDGSPPASVPETSPFTATHVYGDNDSYTVRVTVTDDDSGTGNATTSLAVENAGPKAGEGSGSGEEDAPATLTLPFSDPGFLDTHQAFVHWGDGSSESLGTVTSPITATHVYADDGIYNALVTVIDDDGALVRTTVTMRIEPRSTCDVDGDGDVDLNDTNAIFDARGEPATGPDDPRDANGDGIIAVDDGRICVLECDLENCEEVSPRTAAPQSNGCGLLGIEPFLLLGLPLWLRRRRGGSQ